MSAGLLALAKAPPTYQRVAVIAIAVLVLAVVVELVRRRRLMERYALLWPLAAVGLFVLGVWQGLLTTLATDVGIRSAPNALFALGFAFVVASLLSLTLCASPSELTRTSSWPSAWRCSRTAWRSQRERPEP